MEQIPRNEKCSQPQPFDSPGLRPSASSSMPTVGIANTGRLAPRALRAKIDYDDRMSDHYQPPPHSWLRKFARAFAGIVWSLRGERSCHVHAVATLCVVAAAAFFGVTVTEWCLLTLAIAGVWSAELMNTALEQLARQVDRRFNPELGRALDVASGAVLCMAIGAAVVGLVVFVPYVWAIVQSGTEAM